MPELPETMAYIWQWYADLTWLGTDAINIKAFFELRRISPTPLEFDTLMALIKISKEAHA